MTCIHHYGFIWSIFTTLTSSIREGNGTPLQYSCLESPMDRGAWWAAVHGVVKSRTRLSDFTFTFPFHALEKEMATHSSVLAWRIPGTGEPHGLPSMGSHRVGHDWSNLAAPAATSSMLCLLLFFPITVPSNCWSFYYLCTFAFVRMSYSCKCTMCSLFILTSFP